MQIQEYTGGTVPFVADPTQVLIVKAETIGATVYVGSAAPGVTSGEAAWQLKRIVTSSITGGTLIETAFAGTQYNKVWDSRGSTGYTYA